MSLLPILQTLGFASATIAIQSLLASILEKSLLVTLCVLAEEEDFQAYKKFSLFLIGSQGTHEDSHKQPRTSILN